MEPKVNLWIEIDGQVVLSRWRVELLTAIAETGSISSAADRMGVPYRRAWQKIHEMEERLGASLLETQTGGSGGGGAHLTQAAQDYITRFQQFSEGIDLYVQRHFQEAFLGTVKEQSLAHCLARNHPEQRPELVEGPVEG